MRDYQLALPPDSSADGPLYLQIARTIAADVRRGRLRLGDELPGSRRLAEQLGVHRNTVVAAYGELIAEGWLATTKARGTFVAAALPDPSPRSPKGLPRASGAKGLLGFNLGDEHVAPYPASAVRKKGMLHFAGGIPDVRLMPSEALARAYRRGLRNEGPSLLDYGDPRGHERLRAALAVMLSSRRGIASSSATVLVTRGSQMALDLVARTLLSPGDVVAVEALGYRPAWEAMRLAGARLVPLPVDREGVSVGALAELVKTTRIRAAYVTPHHQYPTTVVLSPGRRVALLDLARRERIAVIEDDYDHEFHYEGRPVLPLASADDAGVVIYVGTLSKVLAPGLRIGFVVAPLPLIERLAARRVFIDRQGDRAVERAVAELIEDGEVQRHARKMGLVYRARRDALVAHLREHLGDALTFQAPHGGMAIWARVRRGIDVARWIEAAEAHGALLQNPSRFSFDGKIKSFLRLGFASLDEAELSLATRRLSLSLRSIGQSAKARP